MKKTEANVHCALCCICIYNDNKIYTKKAACLYLYDKIEMCTTGTG